MIALVTEDDKEALDDITVVFEKYLPDFKLKTTDSGKRCLDIVKENSLDLVILGDLPDMFGLDVIEQISGCSEVPIMILAHTSDESLLIKNL